MERIILHDGIYVYIQSGKITDDSIANADECTLIIKGESGSTASLYGGRVKLYRWEWGEGIAFSIDGIFIQDIEQSSFKISGTSYAYGLFKKELSFTQVTAYLNQIAHMGVDTFLDNYKKNLEDLKAQMKEMATTLENELKENEDSNKAKLLQKIRNIILSIIFLLFSLSINMNAGLDNYQYVDAYEAVIAQCITD